MKFKHLSLREKKSKWRYFFGIYMLDFKNKWNSRWNSKILTMLSYFSIAIFLIMMLLSFSIFYGFVKYKLTHDDYISKVSTINIVIPSLYKNSIEEFKTEVGTAKELASTGNTQAAKDSVKKRYFIYIPFFIFIPVILLITLFHEFGHYTICRNRGIRIKSYGFGALSIFCIPILPLAYVSPYKTDMNKAKKKDFMMMVSGGVSMNLILFLLCILIYVLIASEFIKFLALVSLSVGMFNVLPIGPLDGGLFMRRISKPLSYISGAICAILLSLLFI
jgi:Zn-dependent protease